MLTNLELDLYFHPATSINQLKYTLSFLVNHQFHDEAVSPCHIIIYLVSCVFSQVGKCTKSIFTSVGVQISFYISFLHTYLAFCQTLLLFAKGNGESGWGNRHFWGDVGKEKGNGDVINVVVIFLVYYSHCQCQGWAFFMQWVAGWSWCIFVILLYP